MYAAFESQDLGILCTDRRFENIANLYEENMHLSAKLIRMTICIEFINIVRKCILREYVYLCLFVTMCVLISDFIITKTDLYCICFAEIRTDVFVSAVLRTPPVF